eukprot:718433-Pelagomonas_calceolata.AAC.1
MAVSLHAGGPLLLLTMYQHCWALFHCPMTCNGVHVMDVNNTQAVDEAERALAVVQARLLEALKTKAAQEAGAAAAKHAADQERLRLEAEVGI